MTNWFPTLNQALIAANILDSWDMSYSPISYGENRRYQWNGKQICIYRSTTGSYEMPIVYSL